MQDGVPEYLRDPSEWSEPAMGGDPYHLSEPHQEVDTKLVCEEPG